jgi:hypothetical protein
MVTPEEHRGRLLVFERIRRDDSGNELHDLRVTTLDSSS